MVHAETAAGIGRNMTLPRIQLLSFLSRMKMRCKEPPDVLPSRGVMSCAGAALHTSDSQTLVCIGHHFCSICGQCRLSIRLVSCGDEGSLQSTQSFLRLRGWICHKPSTKAALVSVLRVFMSRVLFFLCFWLLNDWGSDNEGCCHVA